MVLIPKQFDVDFKQRAVRLVNGRLAADETMLLTKAIGVIAKKLGIAPESMRRWYHDPMLNQCHENGPLAAEVKRLRQENAELRQVNKLLKAASTFCIRTRLPNQEMIAFIDDYRDRFGVRVHLLNVGSPSSGWIYDCTWIPRCEEALALTAVFT